MMTTLACSLAVLFGAWTTSVEVAPAAPEPATPGAAFSAAVVERIDAGWRLAMIDVIDGGGELELEVVVAKARRAERLTLAFDADGDKPLAFRRHAIGAPREARVYDNGSELIGTLRRGALEALQAECGSYYVEGAGGGASVDPYDYHTVIAAARGDEAGALLRNAVAGALSEDAALAGVLPHARGYDLVFVDAGEQIVHVELDDANRVIGVDVRLSPMAYHAWARTYRDAGSLGRALRTVKRVDSVRELRSDAGGEPRYELRLDGGATFVLDVADFEIPDDLEDFGCGC